MINQFTSTGFVQRVDNPPDRIPDFDPRSGDHFWMMIMSYRVNPEKLTQGEQMLFDAESLVSAAGPLCYHCEQPYSVLLAKRRCKGHP